MGLGGARDPEAERGSSNERNEFFHFGSPGGTAWPATWTATDALLYEFNVAKSLPANHPHLLQIAIAAPPRGAPGAAFHGVERLARAAGRTAGLQSIQRIGQLFR
ncbi:hypothetical protein [Burkholderia glumae]|uniref:hypothetical protein n=1 Tax=Burkholderia glumae TaxID=337 RepID=UPI00146303C1|nr:hypothetical protein [Burkholderia glumae]QJP71170.1 hypothetical protein HJC54_27795 [Burkholderia glumae]QJW77318.1 hypothetical protein GAS18_06180 [Burkholderia glumae]